MRRTLLAVALAVLMVTAGCQQGPGGPDASPTGTPAEGTPTPTATATGTPTTAAGGLPPGVDESGLENRSALLSAQRDAIAETAYVLETRSNVTFQAESGPVHRRIASTIRSGPAAAEYQRHVLNHTLQGNATTALWTNGSVTLVRERRTTSYRSSAEVSYRSAPSIDDTGPRWSGSEATFLVMALASFEVAGRDGGLTTLEATAVNETAFEQYFGANGTSEQLSAELVVDSRGRIRSFEGTLVADPGANAALDFERVSIRGSWALSLPKSVDVARPAWVPTAYDEATVVDVSLSVVEGRYVTLTNEGPDAIPAGATVGLFERASGGGVTRLEEPVEPGESVYLYRPEGAYGSEVARELPDGGEALSGSYVVQVATREGARLVRRNVTVDGGG